MNYTLKLLTHDEFIYYYLNFKESKHPIFYFLEFTAPTQYVVSDNIINTIF